MLSSLGLAQPVDARTVNLPGGRALVISQVDESEALRRQAVGLGAVTDRPLLEALAGLPLGHPVRWETLDPLDQVQFDGAPTGCIEASPSTVTRWYTPVLNPQMFVAAADGLRSVEQISLFAADGRRLLVGERPLPPRAASRARQLGIGIALRTDRGLELLEAPSGRFVRPGARRWFVQERLWAMAPQLIDDHAPR